MCYPLQEIQYAHHPQQLGERLEEGTNSPSEAGPSHEQVRMTQESVNGYTTTDATYHHANALHGLSHGEFFHGDSKTVPEVQLGDTGYAAEETL